MDKIDPGPGYRLLEAREKILSGDQMYFKQDWTPVEQFVEADRTLPSNGFPGEVFRRKLPTVAPAPGSPEDLASLAELDALIPPVAKILDNVVLDTHFLQWVADRLVHVHGDPETVDFVLRLRALAEMFPELPKPFTPNKYTRLLLTLDGRKVPVDVYSVLAAFPVGNSAVDHALKKLLAPGQRGQKDRLQDLKEARASLDRAIQMEGG